MTLFPTIFILKKLKRLFYYFFGVLVLVTGISLVLVAITPTSGFSFMKGSTNSSLLMLVLVIIAFALGQVTKKELNELRKHTEAETLFDRYLYYYKRRLVLNCIPVICSAAMFVLTNKNIFFYILIVQLLVAFVFFPRQSQILKELPDREIIFQ